MDRIPVARRLADPQRLVLLGTYAAIAAVQIFQSVGRTTFDTKLDLLVDPGRFLSRSLSLWSPQVGMGEVQNQAYGYLFPLGPFFWLGHALDLPAWLTERLWSTALTIVAFEGARRLALAWGGLGWRGALLVGAAFVSAPRFLTTIATLTGEVLPTAVLPWVVLPLVLARRGRLGWLSGMLMSGTALLFAGGQNAVETMAVLPLPAIVLVHAVLRGELPRRAVAVWAGAVLAACTWWLGPLLLLGRYSPPFLDYIESAANTTGETGWVNSVRGADHWVAYVTVGGRPWWPAGFALSTSSWLVVATAAVAALSLAGLVGRDVPDRICLTAPLTLGLVCLVAAHGGWAGGLFSEELRSLLDGALAPLRNVHKVDPLVRLPMALGFGYLAHEARVTLAGRLRRVPTWAARSGVAASMTAGACVLVVLGLTAQPAAAGELRQTPGWSAIPAPWVRAGHAVDALPAGSRVLVVPSSGFGQQVWGHTLDEPLQALTTGDWAARGQAPLVPGANVRLLDSIERVLARGRGSLGLAPLLARSGFTHLLLRTDLDPGASDAPDPGMVESALESSLGLARVGSFGVPPGASLPLQLWSVAALRSADPRVSLVPEGTLKTVQGGPEALLPLLENGLVKQDEPVALADQNDGRSGPVDILTDTLQRREQQFGRVNAATSSLMTAADSFRLVRAAHDYPAFPGQEQTVAHYPGLESVTASSSAGYADSLGAIHPEQGPYSALDGDDSTAWVTAPFTDPTTQSLTVTLRSAATISPFEVRMWATTGGTRVTALRVTTDTGSVTLPVDQATSTATVTLPIGATRSVTFSIADVATVSGSRQVGIADIGLPGVDTSRTLAVPGLAGSQTAMLFGSASPVRACTYPDRVCDLGRAQPAEEAAALDRSFRLVGAGRWSLEVGAVARPTLATDQLLAPVAPGYRVSGSSVLDGDPVVAPVFALDGDPLTSWVTSPGDRSPELTLTWPEKRTLSRIQIGLGTQSDVRRPTVVRLESSGEGRTVSVSPNAFGLFKPLHTDHVTLTFNSGRRLHRGGLGLPMEISDVEIRGLPGVGYSPSPTSATGQPCGFGPPVLVDGTSYGTRVGGNLGEVLDGTPLAVTLCGHKDLDLSAGPHRIRIVSTPQFQAIRATLEPVPANPATGDVPPPPVQPRALHVTSWGAADRTMTVSAGGPSIVWVPENVNAGWVAKAGGRALEPVTLDGWAQGWRLPAGGPAVVTLAFTPQRTYSVALLVGGLLALLLAALTVIVVLRRRHSDWAPTAREPYSPAWWRPVAGLVATAVASAFAGFGLLLGALAGLAPGLDAVWVKRGLVVVAVVGAAWWQVAAGGSSAGADLAAAFAVGLVIGPEWRDSR